MAKILIGCRLPHGLVLHHPDPEKREKFKPVKIAGLRDSKLIDPPYITTEVDADFWQAWKTAYTDYEPLKNGALFEARSAQEADGKGKELSNERTGFEPLKPSSMGVKTATAKD